MTDNKEISEAINVQELFEKSKIDFSKEYIKNLQQSYDDGDLSLELLLLNLQWISLKKN